MMWNVCGLDGLLCEVVQNGVVKKSVWCEMVMGGRLRCNVMSDVEYGGPRRDVLQH